MNDSMARPCGLDGERWEFIREQELLKEYFATLDERMKYSVAHVVAV